MPEAIENIRNEDLLKNKWLLASSMNGMHLLFKVGSCWDRHQWTFTSLNSRHSYLFFKVFFFFSPLKVSAPFSSLQGTSQSDLNLELQEEQWDSPTFRPPSCVLVSFVWPCLWGIFVHMIWFELYNNYGYWEMLETRLCLTNNARPGDTV